MGRLERWVALGLSLALLAVGRSSHATDAGASVLPAGHPPIEGDAAEPTGRSPVARNTSIIDPSLPAGTLLVEIRDGRQKPVAKTEVTVAVLLQAVERNEARQQLAGFTDESGNVLFAGLPTGASASYRVSTMFGTHPAAAYASPPFQLDLAKGQRARIHVYPVTSDIEKAVVTARAMAYFELKDDVLQVTELYEIFNMGQITWVPTDVTLDLPPGARALPLEAGMDDVRFEPTMKGAKLVGTVSPGQHDAELQFQMPYDTGSTFETTLELPPHVATMRVVAEAAQDMTLSVAGFGAASLDRNQKGQRVLVADRQLRAGERPLGRVHITLENMPGPGTGRYWVLALACAMLALGIYLALTRGPAREEPWATEEIAQARVRIIDALQALEQARKDGTLGPKTYAREREMLLDALGALLPEPER